MGRILEEEISRSGGHKREGLFGCMLRAMQCAREACPRESDKICDDCVRYYCDKHLTKCTWCQVFICANCKFDHDADNPRHETGTPNA